ncbi:MAG: hypothetical protein AAFX78_13010 [Cyanobacteria bacterium J06638_20]
MSDVIKTSWRFSFTPGLPGSRDRPTWKTGYVQMLHDNPGLFQWAGQISNCPQSCSSYDHFSPTNAGDREDTWGIDWGRSPRCELVFGEIDGIAEKQRWVWGDRR